MFYIQKCIEHYECVVKIYEGTEEKGRMYLGNGNIENDFDCILNELIIKCNARIFDDSKYFSLIDKLDTISGPGMTGTYRGGIRKNEACYNLQEISEDLANELVSFINEALSMPIDKEEIKNHCETLLTLDAPEYTKKLDQILEIAERSGKLDIYTPFLLEVGKRYKEDKAAIAKETGEKQLIYFLPYPTSDGGYGFKKEYVLPNGKTEKVTDFSPGE